MAKYTLTNRQKLSPTSLLLTLEPSGDMAIGFEPGQYISLRFKRLGRPTTARCFSVVNFPNDQGIIQLGVRVEGVFTTALSEVPTGSEVHIDGPFGQFYLDPDYDKTAVFLAGGIGITPILSIIRSVSERHLPVPMTLLYSCRSQDDVPFAEDLQRLEQINPHLRVVFLITDGPTDRFGSGTKVLKGRVTPELITQACGNDFENTSFFICGPQGFMDAVEDTLRSAGAPDWRINIESFIQAHAARERGLSAATKKLFSVYGLAAMGFIAAFAVIFGTDVYHYAAAEADNTVKTSSQVQSSAASSSDDSAQSASTSESDSSSNPSPTTSARTQQTTTPTYYYQRPVSNAS